MSRIVEEDNKMWDNLKETVKSYKELKKERAETAAKLYETFLKNFIFSFPKDKSVCLSELKTFFNKNKLRIVAIDGTLYRKHRRGCIAFYVLASPLVYELNLENGIIRRIEEITKKNIMVLLPIPLSEIFLLDNELSNELENEEKSLKFEEEEKHEEESVSLLETLKLGKVDNKLMKLAEVYAIYWSLKNLNPDIVMYDGSLFKDYSFSNREVKNINLHKGKILGLSLDSNFFEILKAYPINSVLKLPSPHFTTRFIISELICHKKITLVKMGENYKFHSNLIDDEVFITKRQINNLKKKNYLVVTENENTVIIELKNKYLNAFSELEKLFVKICEEGFDNHNLNAFRIFLSDNSYRYLSEADIDTICRIGYLLIFRECWKKRILLFSIIKDTTERVFIDWFLTIAGPRHINKFSFNERLLPMVPSTDAGMIFDISALKQLHPPLALIEFDPAITAMFSKPIKEENRFELAELRPIQERQFLRTFIQISELDSGRKSYVYTIDRITYPEIEENYEILKIPISKNKIYEIMYYKKPSKILKIIMSLLVLLCSNKHEAVFGYPDPLYEADQYVKTIGSLHKETLEVILTEVDLDEFSVTYRQMRKELGG